MSGRALLRPRPTAGLESDGSGSPITKSPEKYFMSRAKLDASLTFRRQGLVNWSSGLGSDVCLASHCPLSSPSGSSVDSAPLAASSGSVSGASS